MNPVVNPFASENHMEAWSRLAQLRRRWLWGMIVFAVGIPIVMLLATVMDGQATVLILFAAMIPVCAICVSAFAQVQLLNFRCPSCGNRFVLTWASNWPWRKRCPHCGTTVPAAIIIADYEKNRSANRS